MFSSLGFVWIEEEGGGVDESRVGWKKANFGQNLLYSTPTPTPSIENEVLEFILLDGRSFDPIKFFLFFILNIYKVLS